MNDKEIVKMVHGSHMYGLETENSDRDYKGIYMPSERSLLINKSIHSRRSSTNDSDQKNTAKDEDFEWWSAHKFIQLCLKGEMQAIDMLHAHPNHWIYFEDEWIKIYNRKDLIHSKKFSGFLGYINKQAGKYAVKSSRMGAVKQMMDFFNGFSHILKVKDTLQHLPELEHISIEQGIGCKQIDVCGRKIQETTTCGYAVSILEKIYDGYGKRAKQAELNQGIDWKAISHSFRCAYAVLEIARNGDFTYPLKESDFILDVKIGKLNWKNDKVDELLMDLVDQCDVALKESNLPDEPDYDYWDDFIYDLYKNEQ